MDGAPSSGVAATPGPDGAPGSGAGAATGSDSAPGFGAAAAPGPDAASGFGVAAVPGSGGGPGSGVVGAPGPDAASGFGVGSAPGSGGGLSSGVVAAPGPNGAPSFGVADAPGSDGGPGSGAGAAPGSDSAPGFGVVATSGADGAPGFGVAGAPAPVLLGIGVAVPGPLDHRGGVLRKVTGFPQWDGFPLRDALAERLGVPVVVDKDTNAAALGLAPRAADSFAYLHLGTGLGAGLVLGRNLHRGARTDAGEFGHQVLQVDGPPCPCGGHGCAEALCLAAVADGDTARAARLLGIGAANLVRLLDIDLVLLGGRTVLADPGPYVAGVRAVLAGAAPVDVTPSGDRTVVEGAAELVLAPLFGRAGAPGATAFTPRDPGTSVPPSV
ncbi:ROK family protein [Streptomyces albireticuli]|uniref:ROK family protein n=1 Tax=Streptomyces albireticuli TaxID=1940 RepID=UPI0036AD860F